MLNSLLVLAALAVVVAQKEEPGAWGLTLVYFTTSLPFFVSGTIVSLAISETVERIDRVYFFDLLGASAGCLLLVPFLNYFGGTSTVMLAWPCCSPPPAPSGTAWPDRLRCARPAWPWRWASFAFVFYNGTHNVIAIRYAKGQKLKKEEFVQWNSFSRIAVRDYSIFIDADASTGIASFDFEHLTAARAPRAAGAGPGLALRRAARRQGADHRTRRRLGRGARAGFRQPRYYRRRDQPHHRHHRDARPIRGAEPRHLSASGRAHFRGRRPQLRAPQPGEIPGGAGHPGGYLGIHRGRRLRPLGEQSLHHRRPARLPSAPDRRRHGRLHALGPRPAARVAAAGLAGHGGFARNWASRNRGGTSSWAAKGPPKAGARRIPC